MSFATLVAISLLVATCLVAGIALLMLGHKNTSTGADDASSADRQLFDDGPTDYTFAEYENEVGVGAAEVVPLVPPDAGVADLQAEPEASPKQTADDPVRDPFPSSGGAALAAVVLLGLGLLGVLVLLVSLLLSIIF